MIRLLCWLPLLLLAACARGPVLPAHTPDLALPLQLHVQRREGAEVRDWLLVIQKEYSGLRWSLLDPLGVPLARQVLRDGAWQADGLLPPNAAARELFAALLFALAPEPQLPGLYPGRDWSVEPNRRILRIDASSAWQVRYHDDRHFDLDVGPSLTYGVAPIENTGAAAP